MWNYIVALFVNFWRSVNNSPRVGVLEVLDGAVVRGVVPYENCIQREQSSYSLHYG